MIVKHIKAQKSTLSKRITKKKTHTRPRIQFVSCIWTQPWKEKTSKDLKFGGVHLFVEEFSKEYMKEIFSLGI